MRIIVLLLALAALAGCVGPFSRSKDQRLAKVDLTEDGHRSLRLEPNAYDADALIDTRSAPQLPDALVQPQQRGPAPQQVAQVTPGLVLCDLVQAPPEVQAAVVSLPAGADVLGEILIRAPVEGGCIVSGFGMSDARGRPNGGMDFFGTSNVLAAGDGVVSGVGEIPDFGVIVVISHGDRVKTRYANLGELAPGIERGARVTRGQKIAVMGLSGMLPRAGLHYEIEVDGERIDPLSPPPPNAG